MSAYENSSSPSSSSQYNSTDDKSSTTKWTHNATVALIHEYKDKINQFQSSAIRKEVIWKIISTNLNQQNFNYTPKQCEFKFKNLKKKYHAKIDNMKATASGAAAIKFEYFDLFNEMLGHKPNVVPLATASSSRGRKIELDVTPKAEDILQDDDDDDDIDERNKENIQVKKRTLSKETPKKNVPKKTKLDQIFIQLDNINKKREEERYIRHKELIAVQETAIKVFSEKMDKLIDKL